MYYNVSAARLPSQFTALGAECYGLGFPERLLLKSSNLKQKYRFPGTPKDIRFANVVNGFSFASGHCEPDFMISNDETLIQGLLQIRENLQKSKKPLTKKQKGYLSLLEKSFAPKREHFQRHINLELANDAGFPIPRQEQASSNSELIEKAKAFDEPFFIKVSLAAGGTGVIPVENTSQADSLLSILEKTGYYLGENRSALLQAKSAGEELTVSFSAWQGELLGYTVVRPLETARKNGPSSVIQSLYRPQLEEPLKQLVKQLNISGFGGLDVFETNEKSLPEVIEVNLRITHTTPTSPLLGNDLIEKFYKSLVSGKAEIPANLHVDSNKCIALFPDEIMRDPHSRYLKEYPTDMTWDELEINRFLMKIIPKQ